MKPSLTLILISLAGLSLFIVALVPWVAVGAALGGLHDN